MIIERIIFKDSSSVSVFYLASKVEALSQLFETQIVISERSYNIVLDSELKKSLYYIGAELIKGFSQLGLAVLQDEVDPDKVLIRHKNRQRTGSFACFIIGQNGSKLSVNY